MKWITRILALIVVLFGLPFYFGYGNPLPFMNPAYSLHDNLWLIIFPTMFFGLILGWKYEKIAGFVITVPIIIGLIVSIAITSGSFPSIMLLPLAVGIMYLVVGYNKK